MTLRLLHVVRTLRRETGGLAEAVVNLAAAQARQGHEAAIVSLDPADHLQPGVIVLGRQSHGYGFSGTLTPWLRAHAAEYDAVVVHGLWQYQSFGTWRALHGRGVPYIVFPHGMLDVWFKRQYRLKHAKKWLYWPWADYRVLRDAALVCYTAEVERRRARQSFWLYRANERVAPIGIAAPHRDPGRDRAALAAASPELAAQPFLLFLGRVHPKKGIDLLLRGFAAVFGKEAQAPRLAIVGPCADECYRRSLVELAATLGLTSSVSWVPMLSGDAKWGALRACEALVLFSHQENFGVAVVEALGCGRPVLVSDQVAISGEIEADAAGLVAPDTISGATAALRRWRDQAPEARLAMGRRAEACFARRYEVGRAAETISGWVAALRLRR